MTPQFEVLKHLGHASFDDNRSAELKRFFHLLLFRMMFGEGIKPGTERNGTEPEVIVVEYGHECWTRGWKFAKFVYVYGL